MKNMKEWNLTNRLNHVWGTAGMGFIGKQLMVCQTNWRLLKSRYEIYISKNNVCHNEYQSWKTTEWLEFSITIYNQKNQILFPNDTKFYLITPHRPDYHNHETIHRNTVYYVAFFTYRTFLSKHRVYAT